MAFNVKFDDLWMLEHDGWKAATYQERLDGLNELERRVAASQNREPAPVTEFNGELHQKGQHTPGSIKVNSQYLEGELGEEPYDAVATTLHEGFHEYQDVCLKSPDDHPEAADKIDAWEKSLGENYIKPSKSWENYLCQASEVDARAFAAEGLTEIYGEEYAVNDEDLEYAELQRRNAMGDSDNFNAAAEAAAFTANQQDSGTTSSHGRDSEPSTSQMEVQPEMSSEDQLAALDDEMADLDREFALHDAQAAANAEAMQKGKSQSQ